MFLASARWASDSVRAAGAAGFSSPENEASLSEAGGGRGGAGVAGSAGLPAGAEPEEAAGARCRSGSGGSRRWRRRRSGRRRDSGQPGEVKTLPALLLCVCATQTERQIENVCGFPAGTSSLLQTNILCPVGKVHQSCVHSDIRGAFKHV